MLLGRKKAVPKKEFDTEHSKAVIRCSICTGEQVAGFKDARTGKFTEIMLIRSEADLEAFKSQYGVKTVTKEY